MSLKPRTVDFNQVWPGLEETVKGVVTLGNVRRDIWNDRFSDVYSLCIAHPEPLADQLYLETEKLLENHVENLRKNKVLLNIKSGSENQDNFHNGNAANSSLLIQYYEAWKQYSQGTKYLDRLYLYLNQQHIKKQKLSEAEIIYGNFISDASEKMEIAELGLDIWKTHMIEPLKHDLVDLLLKAIANERAGIPNSHGTEVLQGVIHSFVEVQDFKKKGGLTLYQELFETPFLTASGQYYKMEAAKLLQESTVNAYMEHVIQKLEEEAMRARLFLHYSSLTKLRQKCEQHMISDHIQFLYSEIQEMVGVEKKTDMKNLYVLLHPIGSSINTLVNTFLEHIKSEGMKIVAGLKGDTVHVRFVEQMLEMHKKYREMIVEIFSSDQLFLGALDKACAFIINARPSDKTPCRSPELLSKYCDSLLKKSKGMSELEIDEKLTASITIFKYIDDKDVFQKFYSRMLAKRLIHQQSQSTDSEESMINRLKQACGYEFTNKLHRMFTDMNLSKDLNKKFSDYIKENNFDLRINTYILVLQAGAWPLGPMQTTVPFNVPQQFEKSVQMFENFYHNHFSGRKLTWLHHLCQGELKLSYLKKTYIITMQTYQMAILLLFEDCDTLTCREIQDNLQLSTDIFQKHIASLVDSKLLLISSEEMDGDTTVSLNLEYSNKRTKFKITAALQRDTPQEVEHTMTVVEDDRKMYIQAAIVRIMKSRKVLRHNSLIQEVLAQSKVSFAPNIAMIKKCIESLIDKQYIERTPNSSDEYSYVA